MSAYYNEIDPYNAQWLRNLIGAGHVAPGDVDERDIRDVRPKDLAGYTQCHFFAGIGVWSYALRLSGWPDDRPVWTGSCPCQPFSQAGKGNGKNDDRHLWPEWWRLIREHCPDTIFGEQVSSPAGLGWFDLVSADLESEGYAVGPSDTCAAGVAAPQLRQRLYFVASTMRAGRAERGPEPRNGQAAGSGAVDRVAGPAREFDDRGGAPGEGGRRQPSNGGAAGSVASAHGGQSWNGELQPGREQRQQPQDGFAGQLGYRGRPGAPDDFWRDADWIFCADGKWRPVEPGTQPLVDVSPNRLAQLRAYGNALCAAQAQAFIEAAMECLPCR